MADDKSDEPYKPKKFTIRILLPRIVIEELRDVATLHNTTLKEEITRAVLQYHEICMEEMYKGELE